MIPFVNVQYVALKKVQFRPLLKVRSKLYIGAFNNKVIGGLRLVLSYGESVNRVVANLCVARDGNLDQSIRYRNRCADHGVPKKEAPSSHIFPSTFAAFILIMLYQQAN